ncbi:uncharacterized protein LOC109707913 isoform X2 [Ananas comosus]|uniref:Uncharacterized protein LOC109707913 isoform X2 n=1 Tax=Ananas comosus TaxID=4615 RepID=A0A6P5EUT1_ANACO|nr:uncharacterized protein LOC109707913 isoform X2 [Ananas comosus]
MHRYLLTLSFRKAQQKIIDASSSRRDLLPRLDRCHFFLVTRSASTSTSPLLPSYYFIFFFPVVEVLLVVYRPPRRSWTLRNRVNDNWSAKAIRRKTTGTGRMRYLRHVPSRFKSNFREGSQAVVSKKAGIAATA